MVEIDVDITPETDDDDSYSSSFHETDSDSDDKDDFGFGTHYLVKLKVDSQEYKLRMLTQLLRNYSPFLILVYFLRKACFIFC